MPTKKTMAVWSVLVGLSVFLMVVCESGVEGVEASSQPGRPIHIAALLPVNHTRFPFSYQKVLPALELAVENVTAVGGPLHGRAIQVHYRDSECSSAASMNQMFNFYIHKQADVFFGPCCDYAASPVGGQTHYWKLPMLTAGAIARDFAAGKKLFYDFITRVGPSVNSLVDFLLEIMGEFQWKRIKQVYEPNAQSLVGERVCHIMTDGIHYGLQYQKVIPNIQQDYEKVEDVRLFLQRMPEEIGDWASPVPKVGHYIIPNSTDGTNIHLFTPVSPPLT